MDETNLADYLKYIAVNIGFDSLFVHRTPREMIEGYDDAMLDKLRKENLF